MKLLYSFTLLLGLNTFVYAQAGQNVANRYELLSGVRESREIKSFWDQKYSTNGKYVFGKAPSKFLSTNFDYIPSNANVLDVGMGEGRNAVFLARKGYKVTGVDISSVAVQKARRLAQEFGVRIKSVVSSMEKYDIKAGSFDSIICFYYVDREMNKKLMNWLRPGGVLIYESHTDNQMKVKSTELYEKEYLLRPGELLTMFPGMKILKYEEPLHLGEYTASIILQKPLK